MAQARPNIVILATGGTIAGRQASETDPAYHAGRVDVETLIHSLPDLKRFANVRGEQLCSVGSQDMNDEIWLQLLRRVRELVASPEVDGIVITHGTDTLEETAYFLTLTVPTEKPIVMTGAMRPSTSLSPDGPLNLFNAVGVAAHPDAARRGVLVAINDQIHSGAAITKTNTTAIQTFMSPLRGLIGLVSYGTPEFWRYPHRKHTADSEFAHDAIASLPRVDILFAYADMPADLIESSMRSGARGIVVAGVGNGNMSAAAVDALRSASSQGVLCVRSTRTASGVVGRNVEIDDDALGLIAADEHNPQRARVLLRLALQKTIDSKRIQQLFYDY